ncbi:MAG: antA/AntB antirepressor family protein [Magnetococcales bacterium]|nr:antA/AntB antirepressor family protein [Magnetococcales bacterium]
MNDLMHISQTTINHEQVQTVNARELHAFLEVGRDFSTWVQNRIDEYGFVDGLDFVVAEGLRSPVSGSSKARPQRTIEYHLTLDMAKELAMVERNEKGRQARKYFIDCERRLKSARPLIPFTPNQSMLDCMVIAQIAAESLRASEASKILMFSKVAMLYGLPTGFLPDYTDETLTRSLTDLLKEHNAGISAVKANAILLALGILEEKTRVGASNVIHKFKALTEAGLRYGKNLISPQNERETQPHYYVATFPDLLDQIHGWLREAA